MTLDQLRIFVAVAEREHLTRAADALHLTPSAVSSAVQALETRYGIALFHRIGRRIELSETGRIFLVEARAVLASAHTAEGALSELAGLRRGALTIQASQTIASYWLPPFLVAFQAAYPAIAITLREDNSAGVTRAVLAGGADLGFLEGAVDEPTLTVMTVAEDRLVIVAAPDHPLVKRARVKSSDLASASWVLREIGSGTRAVFEDAVRRHGIDPATLSVAMDLPTNEAVCAAARCGPHLTVVSELVARPHLDGRRLTLIPIDLETRAFSLVRHKERYRTKAAQAFEALLPDFREAWSGGGI